MSSSKESHLSQREYYAVSEEQAEKLEKARKKEALKRKNPVKYTYKDIWKCPECGLKLRAVWLRNTKKVWITKCKKGHAWVIDTTKGVPHVCFERIDHSDSRYPKRRME